MNVLPGISPTTEIQVYKSFYYEFGSYTLPSHTGELEKYNF